MKNVEGLEKAIGYVFSDKQLLITALTHPTYANENSVKRYKRIEYLGYAILNFIIVEDLFERYPGADEGVLTTKRIAAVSATPLMKKARELGFEDYIRIARHVNTDGVLGDVFEAVIAAIYLDSGMEEAKRFVLTSLAEFLGAKAGARDYKSRLNEALPHAKVQYREIERSGPDHDPVFVIELDVDGREVARAQAGSKKKAEQECARQALKILAKNDKKG